MKKKNGLVMGLILTVIAGFLIAGCTPIEAGWSLVGTWVNSDYDTDGIDETPGKIVIGSDDTIDIYDTSTSTTVSMSGTIFLDDDWTETGYHWLHARSVFDMDPQETYYALVKISNEGNTYESNSTTNGTYPTAIDPDDPSYQLYTRQ